jgi:L-ascorbate metabolism protein UlaG (beta-lactamase superfamily)
MEKVFLLGIVLITFASCTSQEIHFDEEAWLERVHAADPALLFGPHVDEEGLFFNPWMPRSQEEHRWRFLFRKKIKFDPFPSEQYGPLENDYAYLSDPANNSISFAGHAAVIIKIDGVTMVTDPFFSNRALVVSKKVKIPFDFSKLPQSPVVLITHNHYDHLDTKSIKELIKKEAIFVVALGLRDFFIKRGAQEVYELDWWQTVTIGSIRYTFLPAQHWSRRIGQAANTTLWGGFLVEASRTFYVSGDTGYFCGFREFGKRYSIDYALLSAGAYEPRWFMYYQHMNMAEFFRAADDLNAKTVIPMHFGTISLSDEPLVYPLHEINLHLEKNPGDAGRIRPLRVGGILTIE